MDGTAVEKLFGFVLQRAFLRSDHVDGFIGHLFSIQSSKTQRGKAVINY